ncbi:hypothetical protein E4K72_13940 [Oxalobacteraceae bacterium OM1]|nr:hypothetical protein E4K72_13940 [Oxalobacteraceae bacterium OM1]
MRLHFSFHFIVNTLGMHLQRNCSPLNEGVARMVARIHAARRQCRASFGYAASSLRHAQLSTRGLACLS